MQKAFLKFTLFFFTLLSLGGFCSGANAKTVKTPKPKPVVKTYTRLFYCQNGPKAEKSFATHYRSVDILAPQAYSVSATGTLYGGVSGKLLATARSHKVNIMPLIVNSGFSSSVAEQFLDSPEAQASAIAAMVAEAKDEGYMGWQVDFEQVHISHQAAFSHFVKNLGEALHTNSLQLSVAVIAQTSTNPLEYKGDYWNTFIGVYDYAALASSSDFLSIMSYDDPGSKGPVARLSWLKQVLAFTRERVPAEKISLGVPLYYWRWNDTLGKRVATGGYTQLLTAMRRHYMVSGFSAIEASAYMKYRSNNMRYTIWYENGKSIQKKIDLIKKDGLHGFSAWALGLEVPSIFTANLKNSYSFVSSSKSS